MEYLRSIAETDYFGESVKTQELAHEFFNTMDKDRSGEVDFSEFKQFLSKSGYEHYANSDLFEKLDKDGNGRLCFLEARTLYYIINSGRPFCSACKEFVTAVYFACVDCFVNSTACYLCPSCHKNRNYIHSHGNNDHPVFLDTYTLLHKCSALNLQAMAEKAEKIEHMEVIYKSREQAILEVMAEKIECMELCYKMREQQLIDGVHNSHLKEMEKLWRELQNAERNRIKLKRVSTAVETGAKIVDVGSTIVDVGSTIATVASCSIM